MVINDFRADDQLRSQVASALPEYTIEWKGGRSATLRRERESECDCCCCCDSYYWFRLDISNDGIMTVVNICRGNDEKEYEVSQEMARVTGLISQIGARWQQRKLLLAAPGQQELLNRMSRQATALPCQATAPEQQQLPAQTSHRATAPEQHQMIAPVPLVADELQKLAALKEQGILTQAEFDVQKSHLLLTSRMSPRAPLLQ